MNRSYSIFSLANKLVAIAIVGTIFLCSCWPPWIYSTAPLNLTKKTQNGNEIRFDGIYCSDKDKVVLILYRNGVLRGGQGHSTNYSIKDILELLSSETYRKNTQHLPYNWGLYFIQDSSIYFKQWVSTDYAYDTTSYSGKILNDRTLLIDMPAKDWDLDTFRFYPMLIKPDSVNQYFKKWYRE